MRPDLGAATLSLVLTDAPLTGIVRLVKPDCDFGAFFDFAFELLGMGVVEVEWS